MLQLAIGSAAEVESQLYLSRELGFLRLDDYEKLDGRVNHIRRMLIRLLFKLRNHRPQT
jgi:four helix bundle protein